MYSVVAEMGACGPMDPVQEQVDAFNARDLERFLAPYATDAILHNQDGAVMMEGHDALRAFFAAVFTQSPDLHCEILTRIRVGAYVIDDERLTGVVAEGFPREMHHTAIYQVVDGKIVHVQYLGL